MNFTAELLQNGYVIIQDISVFMKPGYAGIAYSDGDATEKRIADVITEAQDISIFSRELAAQCTDWPSLYHLAGTRANILRPFHSTLQQSTVLEIGAGCGAITRYLGECGAQVLALEGSPRRAAIARSRTRDLENVTVVADKFDQFRCDTRFDVITLIGVLEYAPLFTDGEDPVVSMLSRVREMLKPDGQLILAIENQLGLKYFAGFSEDHKGEPMFGIENRYERNDPQTFGRKVLIQKLELAGFTDQQFMVPFPDYKLPISIVTEQALNCDTFDSTAFAWQTVRRDPQVPQHLVFAPELAWPVVAANGLTLDLANSFLVVAGTSDEMSPDSSILAYHYSTSGRRAAYCKETIFAQQPNGNIVLQYNPLGSYAARSAEGRWIRFNIPHEAEYIQGETLAFQLLRIVTRDNWRIEEVGVFLRQYLAIIKSFLVKEGYLVSYESVASLLPGICFDLVPQNIICSKDGTHQIIDQEWATKDDMPLGWLLFRVLLQLLSSITYFGRTSSTFPETRLSFFSAAIQVAGFTVTREQLVSFAALENRIQADIHDLKDSTTSVFSWNPEAPLPRHSLHLALADTTQRLITAQSELGSTLSHLATSESHLKIKISAIENQNKIIKENEKILNQKDRQIIELEKERENKILKLEDNVIHIKNYIEKIYELSDKNNQLIKHIKSTVNLSIGSILFLVNNYISKRSYKKWKEYLYLKKLCANKSIFDDAWYKNQYPDVQHIKMRPLRHYFLYGAKENRNPNPYFHTKWYIDENKDIKDSGLNPLFHYLTHGFKEGRKPNPLFWPKWYINIYLNPDQTSEPLCHYIEHGYKLGFQPSPYFDPKYYLNENSCLMNTDTEPLLHYLTVGWKEGCQPNLLFNTAWYLHKNKDVATSQIEPLTHYITRGWKEGRDPNPYFNTNWYINKFTKNTTLEEPLLHYTTYWDTLKTNPNPYFDSQWYNHKYLLKTNSTNKNPLSHYIESGSKRKLNPNPYFDSKWYIERYADIKESYNDPFLHFLDFGDHEQRQPNKFFDIIFYKNKHHEIIQSGSKPFLYFLEYSRSKLERPFNFSEKPSYTYTKNYNIFDNHFIIPFHKKFFIKRKFNVIIVTFNSEDFIDNCFISLLRFNEIINLIIVDNNSIDSTIKTVNNYIDKFKHIKLIKNNKNVGLAEANNIGSLVSDSDYFIFLDIDTEIKDPFFFNKLNSTIENSNDDVAAWEFRQIPYEHPKIYNPVTLETGWISGGAFAIKRRIYEEIGGFDINFFKSCEDVDLGWRLRSKGYRLLYCPHLTISHYGCNCKKELKLLDEYYNILNNYFLRLRFGSEYDNIVGNDLFTCNIMPKSDFNKDKNNIKSKNNYFLSTIFPKNKHFTPTLFGYDYDIIRDGALHETTYAQSDSLVSIIIRTIGNINFLRMAIISVLNQTHRNIEIIVVEDGTMLAKSLIDEFNSPLINYIPINKLGRCMAGNVGLKNSKGVYINFLDEDDCLFCDHVDVLAKELDNNSLFGAAWSSAFCIPTGSLPDGTVKEYSYNLSHNVDVSIDEINITNQFPIQAVMFRRECYEKCGGFDPEIDMLEDWDLWLRFHKFFKFMQVKKTTSFYRVPYDKNKHRERLDKLNLFYNTVREKNWHSY